MSNSNRLMALLKIRPSKMIAMPTPTCKVYAESSTSEENLLYAYTNTKTAQHLADLVME